jgi:hypothetical protein
MGIETRIAEAWCGVDNASLSSRRWLPCCRSAAFEVRFDRLLTELPSNGDSASPTEKLSFLPKANTAAFLEAREP